MGRSGGGLFVRLINVDGLTPAKMDEVNEEFDVFYENEGGE